MDWMKDKNFVGHISPIGPEMVELVEKLRPFMKEKARLHGADSGDYL